MPSESVVYTLWTISLVIGVVVVVVVGVLLAAIVRTAEGIVAGLGRIWAAGQRIANNTVHIPLLRQTNTAATAILEHARGIDAAAALIERHAADCPRCPQQCDLAPERRILPWSPS